MTIQNLDYYRRRMEEELAAAGQAGDPAIAQIHREMAALYRDRMHPETGQANGDAFMAEPLAGVIAQPSPAFG